MASSSNNNNNYTLAQSATQAETDMQRLKEAIVDLYLAIKIRSTEEVRNALYDLHIARSNKRRTFGAREEKVVKEDRRVLGD